MQPAKDGWHQKIQAPKDSNGSRGGSKFGDPARRFTGRPLRSGGKVQLGDLTLVAITSVPPLRRLTHALVSVSSSGRGLSVESLDGSMVASGEKCHNCNGGSATHTSRRRLNCVGMALLCLLFLAHAEVS
jgi:hypothetical protein